MRQFLKEQRDLFDFIILDCPPALVVADSPPWPRWSTPSWSWPTPRRATATWSSRLRRSWSRWARIVGAVLNRSKQSSKNTYYYETQDE